MGKLRFIDLSVSLANTPPESFLSTEITYLSHEQGAEHRIKGSGWPKSLFPDNQHLAHEKVNLSTHSGTHMDAPWHYGPRSEGRPSRTIEDIPLEWCFSDGVVLNFTHKRAGELIKVEDLKEALDKIGYRIKPYDIVLIRTDASKHYNEPDYGSLHAGMGRDSTLWLIDKGVKVTGIDAWTWDRPLDVMLKECRDQGKAGDIFFGAHFAGREKEYCHLENLANLDKLPKPFGFKISVFPVKITKASSGWVRAVAIFED
jgi:kynurenine formamidase